ncbi:PorP/SprF family type IX secretion system membrane protein [Mongoliitalea daihaiensis]|uniref:PorP/SprF family type IX secretion system membrane protein n=1 Tax=Mongoliitalea daihaiensis TaxID=2782006 RepID=UPI001F45EF07|nr:type IX secretion system membrane protein PorP/SprF [Mongoliitalea daihaiensis]UJP65217.1 type IX secretion system membrane protein PorP/SprF [Mongoliitalea daihaiensis]
MKKIIIFLLSIGLSTPLFAQSRKYISQFSHLQSYYNPALTGYEGSMIRGFVRNQWVGWEGAPMTYFISGEVDFGELSGATDPGLLGKNALGVNMFHDQYGSFNETELILSYASRIQISQSHNLRLGAGINYNVVQLDGTRFTMAEAMDPILGKYANSFADMQILDFNLGLALTHYNYYVSTAVHNVNVGQINSGDVFMERKPRVLIMQAGYRSELTENLMIATNAMYRGQNDLPDNIELNFKVLMMKRIWLGAGHRVNYANSFQLGLVLDKVRVGYIYEMPMLQAYLLPNTTHEFMLTYSLFGNGNGLMW